MTKQYYDFIFGMGEACSCTQTLRAAKLQFASYPFDWLFGGNFVTRAGLLVSDFASFLEYTDLTATGKDNKDTQNLCEIYYNKKTQLYLNHDFPQSVPLEQSFPSVQKKYRRRCERLLRNIEAAQKILIVYLETPETGHRVFDEGHILQGAKMIQNKWPGKEIHFLYFRHAHGPKQTLRLSPEIVKITADYKQNHPTLDYLVKEKLLVKYLSGVRLRRPFGSRCKEFFLKAGLSLVPFRPLRRNLKRKYHV